MSSKIKLSKLGQRMERRRIELGLSKDEVQRSSKISPNTYYKLLEGQIGKTTLRTFQQIADSLKLNLTELLGDDVFPQPAKEIKQQLDEISTMLRERHGFGTSPEKPIATVAVWGDVAAGLGATNESLIREPDLRIEIPAWVEALPGRKMGYRVVGNSMEPQLYKGDVLVVWYGTQDSVRIRSRQGDVMVVTDTFNDEYVKRCYWNDETGVLILRSVNPDYEDIRMEYGNIKWTGLVVMTVRGDIE